MLGACLSVPKSFIDDTCTDCNTESVTLALFLLGISMPSLSHFLTILRISGIIGKIKQAKNTLSGFLNINCCPKLAKSQSCLLQDNVFTLLTGL